MVNSSLIHYNDMKLTLKRIVTAVVFFPKKIANPLRV